MEHTDLEHEHEHEHEHKHWTQKNQCKNQT